MAVLKPKQVVQPKPDHNIWCPYCDWKMHDTWNNRRRMGEHIANKHYEEVGFPKGTEPKDFEDVND